MKALFCTLALLCISLGAASTTRAADEVIYDQTLAISLQGQEVGTLEAKDTKTSDGYTLFRKNKLRVTRGATVNEMTTLTTVKLDSNRFPISYRYERLDKAGTLVTEGKIVGTELFLVTTQNGATAKNTVTVPENSTFALAVEVDARATRKDAHFVRNAVLEEMGAPVQITIDVKKVSDGFTITSSFQGLTTKEEVDANGKTKVSRTEAVGIVAYPIGRAPKDLVAGSSDLLALSTWKTKSVGAPAGRVRRSCQTMKLCSGFPPF